MKPRAPLVVLTACLLCTPGLAAEITPFFGLRGGATLNPDAVGQPKIEADPALSWGVVLDFKVRTDSRVEVFFDRQELEFDVNPTFELTIDHLQAGTVYEPHRDRFRPFVAAALGLTRFDVDGASRDDSLKFSGSIGGGVKVPIGRRLALRLEARGYAIFGDVALDVVCGPGCSADLATDGRYQLAGRIGLAIRL